ncbi:unnamed protein product, partial [Iphiclides podalirius]
MPDKLRTSVGLYSHGGSVISSLIVIAARTVDATRFREGDQGRSREGRQITVRYVCRPSGNCKNQSAAHGTGSRLEQQEGITARQLSRRHHKARHCLGSQSVFPTANSLTIR